jgi:hypothetical protein
MQALVDVAQKKWEAVMVPQYAREVVDNLSKRIIFVVAPFHGGALTERNKQNLMDMVAETFKEWQSRTAITFPQIKEEQYRMWIEFDQDKMGIIASEALIAFGKVTGADLEIYHPDSPHSRFYASKPWRYPEDYA